MTQKIRPRHPEKVKNRINPIKKKPEWIRSKLSNSKDFFLTKTIVNKNDPDYLDMLYRQKFNYVTEDEIIIKLK